jgi:hypothetical protein
MSRYYFAYGSNMSSIEMHTYCPAALSLGAARLDGWRLAFTSHSQRRQGGVADIVADPQASVWGVLWEVDPAELPALHAKEGYAPDRDAAANHYGVVDIDVLCGGGLAQPLPAFAYVVMQRRAAHIPPHADYCAILRRGALEHALPADYWQTAEQLMAQPAAGWP